MRCKCFVKSYFLKNILKHTNLFITIFVRKNGLVKIRKTENNNALSDLSNIACGNLAQSQYGCCYDSLLNTEENVTLQDK